MVVTTIYQRTSKPPGVCIRDPGHGTHFLEEGAISKPNPSHSSSLASQLYTSSPSLTLAPSHTKAQSTLHLSTDSVLPLDTPLVIYFRSSRQSLFEYSGFLSKHPPSRQLRWTSRKLTSPVTPHSTFAYHQHTTSMVMTRLQFTLSSFLTLFTRPLTRHDPMLMSRNDSIQSKFNDSYGYAFEPRLFKSTLLCSLNLCYLVGVSLSLRSQWNCLTIFFE
jgi:hypothetical protein